MENDKIQELKEKVESIFSESANLSGDISHQVSGLESVKNQIMTIEKTDIKTIEDKEFVEEILKQQIRLGMSVLEKAASDIKTGSPATYREAWAMINTSVSNTIKEFIAFKKMIHDLEIVHNPPPVVPQTINQNLTVLDSTDLLKYLNKVRSEAEINRIVPKFKTDNKPEEGSGMFDVKSTTVSGGPRV